MKLKTLALMSVICTSVVFTACKKDDDDKKEETPATSIEGTWKTTALTMRHGLVDTTEDVFSGFEACEKDDLKKFNADKTVTDLAGATKCDPSEADAMDGGFWALSPDNKKFTLITGDTNIFDVVTLNATTLKLKLTDIDDGDTLTLNVTLIRQ